MISIGSSPRWWGKTNITHLVSRRALSRSDIGKGSIFRPSNVPPLWLDGGWEGSDADAVVVGTDQQAGLQPSGVAQGQVPGDLSRRPHVGPAVSDAARSAPGRRRFIFVLVYGSRSDWVQNVLASGTAKRETDGVTLDLVGPELITADEAFERLSPGVRRPPKLLKIDEFLAMRLVQE